jgi:hypothetical protein
VLSMVAPQVKESPGVKVPGLLLVAVRDLRSILSPRQREQIAPRAFTIAVSDGGRCSSKGTPEIKRKKPALRGRRASALN